MASPLGLTSFSRPNQSQRLSDNYSNIRYVSKDKPDSIVNNTNYVGDYNSVLNGTKWYYRPKASLDGDNINVSSRKRHDSNTPIDDIYDISTNSIIDYTNNQDLPALKLNPAHFVYSKDYGVYPNNRLIICRRFPSPVDNDLTAYGNTPIGPSSATIRTMTPLSTIVSWIPDDADNFFSFEVGEDWVSNEATDNPVAQLTGLFNDAIGKLLPIAPGGEMKGVIDTLSNLLPSGGVPETLETAITNYLLGDGKTPGSNFRYDNLHKGNPNYLSESAYRGLNSISSKISIPVKVVYEMKYINGTDPTIAFMDVIQNVLRFSSSQSVFYLSQAGGDKINSIIKKYKNGDWFAIINDIVTTIIQAVKDLTNTVSGLFTEGGELASSILSGEKTLADVANMGLDSITNALSALSRSALARYRIEFNKIIPAMTGLPSAPWHVTIGNPKNPFLSSGDMIVENGEVSFGNILGFNDLPTRIEFSFTIKSARNLGIQEIFDKFNVGSGRQYQRDAIKFDIDWNQGRIRKDESEANSERNNSIINNKNNRSDEDEETTQRQKEIDDMIFRGEAVRDYTRPEGVRILTEDEIENRNNSGPIRKEESQIRYNPLLGVRGDGVN